MNAIELYHHLGGALMKERIDGRDPNDLMVTLEVGGDGAIHTGFLEDVAIGTFTAQEGGKMVEKRTVVLS